MTLLFEDESERELPFNAYELAIKVIEEVMDYVNCPYEAQINLLLTTDEEIRRVNKEARNIDLATDVLSFPTLEYDIPGEFDFLKKEVLCFHPESGELLLGDILLSVDKVYDQAEEFVHSPMREYAFLIAHSMLHLCGYDHIKKDDALQMEKSQEDILNNLGITRG